MHSDPKIDRTIIERRAEPRLSKYVRRHHPTRQIIGDKEEKPMTINRLINDTYFLINHEPNLVKDS